MLAHGQQENLGVASHCDDLKTVCLAEAGGVLVDRLVLRGEVVRTENRNPANLASVNQRGKIVDAFLTETQGGHGQGVDRQAGELQHGRDELE